jgi:hypothetical protein
VSEQIVSEKAVRKKAVRKKAVRLHASGMQKARPLAAPLRASLE